MKASKFVKVIAGAVMAVGGFVGSAWSGSLPAGYTQIEYIESTGTQWINTGIDGTATYGIEFGFCITGCQASWSSLVSGKLDNFTFGEDNNSWTSFYLRYRGEDNGARPTIATGTCNDVAVTGGVFTVNGGKIRDCATTPLASSSGNVVIFNNSGSDRPSKGRCYYMKIYNGARR